MTTIVTAILFLLTSFGNPGLDDDFVPPSERNPCSLDAPASEDGGQPLGTSLDTGRQHISNGF